MNKLSGYTELQVSDKLTVPLKYGMWSFRELCRRWDTGLEGIEKVMMDRMTKDPISASFDLIAVGAEYAQRALGKHVTYDDAVVSSWIDDTGGISGSPVITQAMNAFCNALGLDLIPAADPDEQGE